MRILYFSSHPTHDTLSDVGYSTHQREMIEAMLALGHEVIPIIIGNDRIKEIDEQAVSNGSVSFISRFKRVVPSIIWQSVKDIQMLSHGVRTVKPRFEQAIIKFKPDAIYERTEILIGVGAQLAAKHKVPHIYEVNGPGVEEMIKFEGRSLMNGFAERLEKIKYRSTSAICSVSQDLSIFLQNRYSVNPDKITTIPNAYNPEHFSIYSRNSLDVKFNFKSTDLVFGFVGSILPFHGVDLLVNAFAEVKKSFGQVKLLIVGSGMSLADLKLLAQKKGVSNDVFFTGQVKHYHVKEYMQLMDVAIMAKSNWYGSPVKIFEYGAMKKAIIAPNVGPVRDVMQDGEHGLLIEPDLGSLVEAMKTLATDVQLRVRLAEHFHQKVLMNHTWENNAKRVINIFNGLMK